MPDLPDYWRRPWRWRSTEGAAEDVAKKDKLPLKNYAHCDSFDALLHSIIT